MFLPFKLHLKWHGWMLLMKMPWKISYVRNEWFIITQNAGRGISEKERIDVAFCWRFSTGPVRRACFPGPCVCGGSFHVRCSPLWSYASTLPSTWKLSFADQIWTLCHRTRQGGEGLLGLWGTAHQTRQPLSSCHSRQAGEWRFCSLESLKELHLWNGHSLVTFQAKVLGQILPKPHSSSVLTNLLC